MGCSSSKDSGGDAKGGVAGKDLAKVQQYLQNVPLFQQLDKSLLTSVAKGAVAVNFGSGKTIIEQGDDGAEFFVINSGDAQVEVDGAKVATLKTGDFFGERALIRNEPRTATIKAATDLSAYKITRQTFNDLGLADKLDFTKRAAVGGGGDVKTAEIKEPSSKTEAEKSLIAKALSENTKLSMFELDAAKINGFTGLMWKEDVPAGKAIVNEGDTEAHYFYIVQSGKFQVTAKAWASATSKVEVEAGGSFGELALLYLAPRAATVTAVEKSVVWVIARQQFRQVLQQATPPPKQVMDAINSCDQLACLKDEEKRELVKLFTEITLEKNETIFEEKEKGDKMYLLVDGAVAVIQNGKEVATLNGSKDKACVFGELALLNQSPRNATIKVTSEKATALFIDKASFDMSLGPLEEFQKRAKGEKANIGKAKQETTKKQAQEYKYKDFKQLHLLGCGGFGAVHAVENQKTKEVMAMKALSKGYVIKAGMQQSVMSEKNVQLMCDSPFIVMLYATFNGSQSLYLLLELCIGGELYATYNKKGLWGNADCARFYVGGTVFAFEHLHGKKIIFRDLKPENLLLTWEGKIKLTDMGLAKVVVGKTYTTCGTPDYFAPELIASKGHCQAVDWWTLGVLTFELLSGHPPFESASPMQIYAKVQKGIEKVAFPKACKGTAETLIKALCKANPSERLPMKKNGLKNTKNHKWFEGFDWDAMFAGTLKVPYTPTLKGNKDFGNFSARKEDLPPQIKYKDPGTGWDKDFATGAGP